MIQRCACSLLWSKRYLSRVQLTQLGKWGLWQCLVMKEPFGVGLSRAGINSKDPLLFSFCRGIGRLEVED